VLDLAVLGLLLDSVILKVFSNLSDSVLLWTGHKAQVMVLSGI